MQDEKNDKPEENLLKQKIFDYVAELVSNEVPLLSHSDQYTSLYPLSCHRQSTIHRLLQQWITKI